MTLRYLFGSPLRRMRKRIAVLEKAILSAQITAKSRSSIAILQRYNDSIRRNLERLRSAFLANANYYNESASNRSLLPQITATLAGISTSLKHTEQEINSNKSDLEAMQATDPAFLNAWLTEILNSYRSMLTSAELLDNLAASLKDPDEEKHQQKVQQVLGCPIAQEHLKSHSIPERRDELVSIARKCGYLTTEGGAHIRVTTSGGGLVTLIPRSNTVAKGTAKQIMEGLATGTFAGRTQVQRAG